MRLINTMRIYCNRLVVVILFVAALLAGCLSEQAAAPALSTGKPALLRSIDNSVLSVVVQIEESGREFIGQQREDGSWYVQMNVASGQAHAFVASWYANLKGQRVLLVEQHGEFFAGPTRVQSDAKTVDVSEGNGFDSDCDGASNLAELEANSDPLSSPGCSSDSQTNSAEASTNTGETTDASSTATNNADGAVTAGTTTSTGSATGNDVIDEPSDTGNADEGGTTDTDATNGSGGTSSPVVSATMPELVPIPAGCFTMGSPLTDPFRQDDERQHEVCVEAFEIGRHEVTFDQYIEFVGQFGSLQSIPFDSNWGKGSRPVINVSWRSAVAFTQWLSESTGDTYRLPTEAEWEYAARGGTQTLFWTGDTLRDDQENFDSTNPWGGGIATGKPYENKTLPVGSLQLNPFGLYDMLGNVIEFTCSLYSDNYENNLENQCDYDMTQEHVARGGVYNYIASWSRSSTRTGKVTADEINGHIGFRVVRENR